MSYQLLGQKPVSLGSFGRGSAQVTLQGDLPTLRADGSSFLNEWHGSQVIHDVDRIVDIPLEKEVNRVTVVGAIFGVLCAWGAFKSFVQRKRNALERELAELDEPLIRSDGALPKRKIGGYQAVAQLGAGGMGVVYKAVAADGHTVAIKVPAPHLIAEANFRDRFTRELELAYKLKHPRVISLVGLPEGNEAYIVLEYLEGKTLENCPRLPWLQELRRCLVWLRQALEGLAYVHGEGIVHRDLKPANLMVLKDGSLKLMDFGIAHKLHGTRLTGTDTILGTPNYMAPEQLQGLKVDGRTDLYALGLIFYERLAGGLPFPDDLIEIFRYKLHQELPPLRTLLPEIPADFDAFIAKLIAIDPDKRFLSAQAALEALPQ